jgi:predicted ATP-grasp superfamily ATP-dependent carboligase
VVVVILDGNQRSALAATRSLGRKGIFVSVGSETVDSISARSKYCKEAFSYPSPYTNPQGFVQTVKEYVSNFPGGTIFPMTDVTLSEILRNRGIFGDSIKIPFVDHEQYEAVSNKVTLFRLAKKLGVPTPRTLFSSDGRETGDLIDAANDIGFPVVLKPALSHIRGKSGWVNTSVCYAKDSLSLETLIKQEPFKSYPFLIQERIEGYGMGVFLLMREGSVLTYFAHRRIREKPPSGGVSVLCESVETPSSALESAVKLLGQFSWSGVVMVEFKNDIKDNIPKLMEVNARFWGSLQLAVSAGVNFPHLLFLLAQGKKIESITDYKTGLRSRWELGDLDHLIIRLKGRTSDLLLSQEAPSKLGAIRNFITDFFRPSVRNEVFRFDDPVPFFFEVKDYIRDIVG